jgi:predicted aldo/keto reductase-like oxidoreductase
MSLNNYEGVDTFIPLSGTTLSQDGLVFLKDYEEAYGTRYCRHACNKCAGSCSKGVPVSTIMRYSYYFKCQGREKYAMKKYAALGTRNASLCESCGVPCDGACPYGVNIRANLFKAHSLLRLA